jgi:hypothetical protein
MPEIHISGVPVVDAFAPSHRHHQRERSEPDRLAASAFSSVSQNQPS